MVGGRDFVWRAQVKTRDPVDSEQEETPLWRKGRERGALVGMFLTVWVYRQLGRWFADLILWFVVTYFFITSWTGRQASRDFLSRATKGTRPSLKNIHAHFMDFAQTSLDRFDVWTGDTRRYHYTFKGRDHLDRLVSTRQGAVLVGAHFGNSDALRALIDTSLAKVHFLTDQRGARKFFSVLQRFCPRMVEGATAYDVRHPENVIALKAAVERGEFVGLLADRNVSETGRGSRRVMRVPFLGSRAAFPQAPFLFAALLRCPVLFIAGVRRARWEYDLIVEPIADRVDLPEEAGPERDRQLDPYVMAFAKKLESYAVQFPTQWFNFYDFWRA